VATPLPRLAPTLVTRPRISGWLERHADLPLRYLAAAVGAGKTTAVATYLAGRRSAIAYLALRADETLEAFRERLARAFDIPYVPASFDALLAALATVAPCEIAVDDIDGATAETLEELGELAAQAPAGVSLIACARSRSALDARSFLARGLGAILDGPTLAFDPDEIARLAELQGIGYLPADVARLRDETDGWPIVVSWAIRDAVENGGTLAGAYDRWRRDNGRHFREFVEEELRAAGDRYRAAFRTALRGTGSAEERERLAELEERGLFVYFDDGLYRPYRVARQIDLELPPQAGPVSANSPDLLVVRMFGRFEAEIGGQRIEWIRRREAQLFKYLLLKPSGSATRAELRATFWQGTDAHLATQSLRTASSNIRKAIATVTGYAHVDRYFSSSGDISVVLENAVIDVRRFTAHVADGDAELEAGRSHEAFAHYRAAEALYSGELLSGEYPEQWYRPRAEMYRALYGGLLERIAEFHADAGHPRLAREYAERARELRPGDPSLDRLESRLSPG
jgi:DNA-binding SARP family transcriptional activator